MKQHLNLINGEWVGASFAENRNPSDLTAPLGLYARATVEDTQAAIAAARAALPAWSTDQPAATSL